MVGRLVWGVIFALNSAVHSFLILHYAEGNKVAMNVGSTTWQTLPAVSSERCSLDCSTSGTVSLPASSQASPSSSPPACSRSFFPVRSRPEPDVRCAKRSNYPSPGGARKNVLPGGVLPFLGGWWPGEPPLQPEGDIDEPYEDGHLDQRPDDAGERLT